MDQNHQNLWTYWLFYQNISTRLYAQWCFCLYSIKSRNIGLNDLQTLNVAHVVRYIVRWFMMGPPFWCGHVGVTLEYFFYYPSVYDLHWSHYYSEVIHIQNNLFFLNADFISGFVQVPSKNYLNIDFFVINWNAKCLSLSQAPFREKKSEPVPETVSNC